MDGTLLVAPMLNWNGGAAAAEVAEAEVGEANENGTTAGAEARDDETDCCHQASSTRKECAKLKNHSKT